ncbi:MAG: DsbA family protein [Bdellovibrionales bacterium]
MKHLLKSVAVIVALGAMGIYAWQADALPPYFKDGSSSGMSGATPAAATTTGAPAETQPPKSIDPAQASSIVPERILGKADAPVTVHEFVSLTCPHCAQFYTDVLPKLKEKYVDTGKVRFIMHDFPMDGVGLRASALARCMPAEQFYPFVEMLFKNQQTWAMSPEPDKILTQYAKLGGLPDEKAKACLTDTKMQDALIALREDASKQYTISSTPTFIINNGADKIEGAQSAEKFSAAFDKLLAPKP